MNHVQNGASFCGAPSRELALRRLRNQPHEEDNQNAHSLDQVERDEREIDQLDPDERRDQAANAVNQHVPLKNLRRADRAVFHAAQRERNQRDDDERVENDRAEDGARRANAVA